MAEPKPARYKNLAEMTGTDVFTAQINQLDEQHSQPDPKEVKFLAWLSNVGLFLLVLGVLAIIFLAPGSTTFKEIINVGATGITIAGLGFALMSLGYSVILSMLSEKSAKRSAAELQQSLITVSLQISTLHDALNEKCPSCLPEVVDAQRENDNNQTPRKADPVARTKQGINSGPLRKMFARIFS